MELDNTWKVRRKCDIVEDDGDDDDAGLRKYIKKTINNIRPLIGFYTTNTKLMYSQNRMERERELIEIHY